MDSSLTMSVKTTADSSSVEFSTEDDIESKNDNAFVLKKQEAPSSDDVEPEFEKVQFRGWLDVFGVSGTTICQEMY
jgi:hypothetical protein